MIPKLNCSECGAFLDDEAEDDLCRDCAEGMDSKYWDKHDFDKGFQITERP